jgi:glycosyltransferase involved in cell wall biosynthesis
MLRVALDVRIYGRRGIGRYASMLHEGLLARTDSLSVTALASSFRPGGWTRLRSPGYVLQEQLEIPRRVTAKSFDVVHLTANTAPVIQFGWPATVVTVHDVMYLRPIHEVPLSPVPRQLLGRVYRSLAFVTGTLKADHLIADSKKTADDLHKMFRTLPPVTVVPLAVDPRFARQRTPDEVDKTLQLRGLNRQQFFLHAGAKDPRKNTGTVIHGHELYLARGGKFALAVVGFSESDAARASRKASGSSRDRFVPLPFVSDDEMATLMQAAAALVYVPSYEGFGLPLLEALSAGTPAIISAIPALVELADGCAVEVGVGRREELADAMFTIERRTPPMTPLVQRGLRRAASFTRESMVDATVSVYEQAISDSARRHGTP